MSRHLGVLRRAGLVLARRDGRWMWYRLAPGGTPLVRALVAALLGWIAGSMAIDDPALLHVLPHEVPSKPGAAPSVPAWMQYLSGAVGALVVLASGKWLAQRRTAAA